MPDSERLGPGTPRVIYREETGSSALLVDLVRRAARRLGWRTQRRISGPFEICVLALRDPPATDVLDRARRDMERARTSGRRTVLLLVAAPNDRTYSHQVQDELQSDALFVPGVGGVGVVLPSAIRAPSLGSEDDLAAFLGALAEGVAGKSGW